MNAIQEVREQYKQATRTYIEHRNAKDRPRIIDFHKGRMSGLDVALSCLGVTSDEIREMYNACEKEIRDEPEQEELDAIERPASQAQVEADESGEDIYECEHCNAEFRESEILRRDFGGEIGTIEFCPRCKEETKLICVTEADQ